MKIKAQIFFYLGFFSYIYRVIKTIKNMTELEKKISGIKDSILVAANVAITELAPCKYGIVLDKEHYLCFRASDSSVNSAIERLSKVVDTNRLSVKELELC
jgi:hypothetical protein